MAIVPAYAAGTVFTLAKPVVAASLPYAKLAAAATAVPIVQHVGGKVLNFLSDKKDKLIGYASKGANTVKYIGKKGVHMAKGVVKGTYDNAKWVYGRTIGTWLADDKEAHKKKVDRELEKAKDKHEFEGEKIGTFTGAVGKDLIADKINQFYGIDVTSDDPKVRSESQGIQALNVYSGGTQLQKAINNLKSVNSDWDKTWRDTDWSALSGGAAELIGRATQDDPNSKWSPLVAAGIGAAKTYMKVTNPLLGAAMDVGGLLATTPAARKAAEVVGKGALALGKGALSLGSKIGKGAWKLTKKLFKGKDPALQHSEDVIPIYQEPEYDDPPVQKPIDYSGINIPNLLPQESNAAYMMRMTGGMNVGPANANVVSYSGYRKPQYQKTANRVMMAPPRAATKRVKVRRRKA